MERKLIEAVIDVEVCTYCKSRTKHIRSLCVWSKTPMNVLDPWQMTSQILAKGMYEFHQDLPIRTVTHTTEIPVCADCLVQHMENERKWTGE
jgi:hypothetical protein